MPRVGFETTIPAFEWAKTVHALDRAATVIGIKQTYFLIIYLIIRSFSEDKNGNQNITEQEILKMFQFPLPMCGSLSLRLLRAREVFASILGVEMGYTDRFFAVFLSCCKKIVGSGS
jgi:hypothetical protein